MKKIKKLKIRGKSSLAITLVLLFFSFSSYAQNSFKVTGTVVDGSNVPLPGASIVEKGTSNGVSSDFDGKFSIIVTNRDAILQVSYIGYEPITVNVDGNTSLTITLVENASLLEEVVLVGYGSVRRSEITGAIASVSEEEIKERPVADVGNALQGRASGVVATSAGSSPGDGVTIRIRGRRSLKASNDPLYVVDGIPYEGNINDINPGDIKSIEVLKDASATAIYGSRGANGVILVTTARGGNMPTTVSYSSYYGVTTPTGTPDMMNGAEFFQLKVDGGSSITDAEREAFENGVSTDWIDLALSSGYRTSHQLGFRGGDEKTSFAVSANYFNEKAVIKTQDFTRKTFRVNLDHKLNDWFKIGTSTQISDQTQNRGTSRVNISGNETDRGTNSYGRALNASPLAAAYDENGELIYQPAADPLAWNPIADYVENTSINELTRLRVFSNIFAEAKLGKDLSYRMNYGTDYQKTREGFFEGRLSSSRQYSDPRATQVLKSTNVTTFENILTFDKRFNDNHKLGATGLFSIQESNYEMAAIDVEGLPYEQQLFHNLSTAETVLAYDSDLQEWGIMSFMGRLNYNYKDKYLLTLTGRYDGSSRLAEGKKWGFFPSAALMWNIGNEAFLENQETITDLRLRASYGVTGNTAIDPYQTRGGLGRTVYSFGDSSGYGYRPSDIANADLQWETSASSNIGLDFGIGQFISGSVEVYQTKTTDLLLERKLPITSGFDNVLTNIGETQNQGWEVTLNAQIVETDDFSWSTNLNVFGNKEKIIDIYGDKEDDIGNKWFIGSPLTVWYDYKKTGVWQLGEEDEAAAYQVTPGVIKVEDVNDDGLINQDDRQILGSDIPDFSMGFSSRVEYKNMDFSFLLFGAFGQTVFNEFEDNFSSLQGRFNNLNVDYWTPDNPTNDQPMADGSRERPLYNSTRAYQKGDFLKVKNIQLGYSIPKNALSKIGLRNLRVYVNADSPFTFSNVADNGLDPESYGGRINGRLPTVKMFSMGFNVDF